MAAPNATYNGISVGDYAWLISATNFPDTTIRIPRAQGIRQRDEGGGEQTLVVKAWVVKDNQADLAAYFESLPRFFGTGIASLVIDGNTYTNCKCLSINPEDRYQGSADHFTCVFRKSAMTQ